MNRELGLVIGALLAAAIFARSRCTSGHLARVFRRELLDAGLPTAVGRAELIDEASIAALPEPVPPD